MEKEKKNHVLLEQFKKQDFVNISNYEEIESNIELINELHFTYHKSDRNTVLKDKIMQSIKIVDDYLQNMNQINKKEISFLFFAKSVLLDKLPEYSKVAEDSANKSLKLNPFIADSYNCIAHIIWKKGDLEQATQYFKQALEIDERDKTALRNLSMITRAKNADSNEERVSRAEESMKYAKMAIDLNIKDSESWYIFGNSYFHYAFLNKLQYENLQKAVNCYNLSEKYETKYKNPDLYYNRATVHLYLENYSLAYNDLKVADNIDANLKAGELADNIMSNLIHISRQIKTQCNLKTKKLTQIINLIPTNLNSQSGYELTEARPDIEWDKSKRYIVSSKVIQIAEKVTDIPISLICVDHKGNFFVLSIYNLSKEFKDQISEGNSHIVLLDPKIVSFSLSFNGKDYDYPKISMTDLSKVLLNGKYCACFSSFSESTSTFFV